MSIILRDLMKVYRTGRSEVIALREVNAEFRTGEFVAVMGPSGCGKTTLLNIIGGLDLPTAGSVIVNGSNIVTYKEKDLVDYRRKGVGIVFQFFNLVPTLTARENVELPMLLARTDAPTRTKRTAELLEAVGMGERGDHRPDELSGGEQQRIAIAVALANDPPIVLADEPTGELDSTTGAEVISLFRRLHKEQDKTVIIVTHDPGVASSAERILSLRDGRVVKDVKVEGPTPSPEQTPPARMAARSRIIQRIRSGRRAGRAGRPGA